ncbi:MAG: gcvH [Phycisphaerales bacterium]|nr:gcvH [Phycisphaerales bacterium]
MVAINEALNSNPGTVNTDPFEGGWMIKIKPDAGAEGENLLDAAAYTASSGH